MKYTMDIKRGQIVTRRQIEDILRDARNMYHYAKFNFYNGIYISVTFYKDNSIDIMSNSRNLVLWQNINQLRISHSQQRVVDFIFRWINNFNR